MPRDLDRMQVSHNSPESHGRTTMTLEATSLCIPDVLRHTQYEIVHS